MAGKSARARKWTAAALHAARAAAFLTIATGVNGTLAAMWPRYEPIYAYLVAILVVSALSSALLGVTSAIAAVILYDWMFAPVHIVPSFSIAIPIAVAVLIAVTTRAAVPMLQLRALPAVPVETPLLPAVERPAPVDTLVVDDDRVAALTEELAGARDRAREEARLRAEADVAARSRETELAARFERTESRLNAVQRELEEARARVSRETSMREQLEVAGHHSLQKAVDDLSAKHEAAILEAKQRLEVATKKLESAQHEVAGHRERAEAAAAQVGALQSELAEQRARADRESQSRADVERSTAERLQKAIFDMNATHGAALVDARKRAEAAAAKVNALQSELAEERARAEREAELRSEIATTGAERLQTSLLELNAKHEAALGDAQKRADAASTRLNAMQRELDRTLASLADEHARADRQSSLRSQLEAAARATLHRTADVSAGHQREAEEARGATRLAEERARAADERAQSLEERARAAEDAIRTAEQRAVALEQQVEQLRFEISELRGSAGERSRAAESAQQRAAALQSDIQQILAAAEEQEHRSQEAMQARAAAAEQERRALQAQIEALREEVSKIQLHAEFEAAAHAKVAADLASARQDLEAAHHLVDDERSQRESGLREADERLKRLIDGINADYESAVGEALIEKEAAKAELRALNKKLQELQSRPAQMSAEFDAKLQKIVAGLTTDYEHAIGDATVEREAARAEARTLTHKVQELQRQLSGEKAAREQADNEWNAKLQKIVTHLAQDHEADIGEAMLQKEGARAEARTLASRLAALQKQLEDEREKFRQAFERWQQRTTLADQ
ncbi:MAG TPA: hypothetical protein VF980_17000, partial [Thermoanaerobaculia bacterium]